LVPLSDRSTLLARLGQRLLTAANRTGGWPYYGGKSSRIEPTGWALLALAGTSEQDAAAWQKFATVHLQFLVASQRSDGLLVEHSEAPPNFTGNGLAAAALLHLSFEKSSRPSAIADRDGMFLTRLLGGIVSSKGVAVKTADEGTSLQAWPWIPDTYSWVEPTAWCLLALKRARPQLQSHAAESRIAEAEKLLINRLCVNGGWNYGSATALGQDLRPYVPTTAAALIALQDRRKDPAVARAVEYLHGARLKEPSAMALAFTAVSLRLLGLPVDDVDEHLAAGVERAERIGNLQALAMALYALSAPRHDVRAFRV
jgi:hypothetical protein